MVGAINAIFYPKQNSNNSKHICTYMYYAQPRNHKFDETFLELTLNGSCRGADLEKYVFGKCSRCRIVTSVVENVADVCQDRHPSKCRNCVKNLLRGLLYNYFRSTAAHILSHGNRSCYRL